MRCPTVTVIVDTYNHERFIEQALGSVLDQDYPQSDMEIVVVDDGSTDKTPDLLRKFGEKITVIQKRNGGQASAFNAAIPLAKGEIVAFLDGDDWWAKNKLSTVMSEFSGNPEIGVVGHGFYEYLETAQQAKAVLPESTKRVSLKVLADGRAFANSMCFFGTSRVSIRKRVLDRIGQIPETLLVEADEFMSTMAVAKSGGVILKQPLTFYRLHAGNLFYFASHDEEKSRRKMSVLCHLGDALRSQLQQELPSRDIAEAVVLPIEIEARRLKLSLDGGWPWETVRIERASLRLAYKHMGWKYRLFKIFPLFLMMVLPPKRFYKVREFYSKMNLKRLRKYTGEPVSSSGVNTYNVKSREN